MTNNVRFTFSASGSTWGVYSWYWARQMELVTLNIILSVVSSDCDYCFLKCFFDWILSGSPTLFYTMSLKIEVTIVNMLENGWESDKESYMSINIFGGHLEYTTRDQDIYSPKV
jgi:hypothetical protein